MRRVRPRILRSHGVHARRHNLKVLNFRHPQPVAARSQSRRHRNRAIAHRPSRARPHRSRESAPARRKDRVPLHQPARPAASRRRTPLGCRTRNIQALIHIDRQIVDPRVAQHVDRVRPRRQHILARKSHQRRDLLAQSPDRLPEPTQRPRLASALRNRQRHPMRLRIIQRRLQRIGIVGNSIAHCAKFLHAALNLLRAIRPQIVHIHAIRICEPVRPRIGRRNLHGPAAGRRGDCGL